MPGSVSSMVQAGANPVLVARSQKLTVTATAYGPPWTGIQGTGVTAGGIDLRKNPHFMGIAVDPSVIPIGSEVLVASNPYGHPSMFLAFDTGGAIKGNHIDIYDSKGRADQNKWGSRTINIVIIHRGNGKITAEQKLRYLRGAPLKTVAAQSPLGVVPGAQTAVDAAGDAIDAATAIPDFLSKLGIIFTGEFWIRAGKVFLGLIAVVLGIVYLGKVFSGTDTGKAVGKVAAVAAL